MQQISESQIEQTKKKAIENLNKNLPLPNPSPEEISKVFNIWRGIEKTDDKTQSKDKTK